jgi:hypothetical protein
MMIAAAGLRSNTGIAAAHRASVKARIAVFCLAVLVALFLAWSGLYRHLERSCLVDEWPNLPYCQSVKPADPSEAARVLRARIDRNPGDSASLLALAVITQGPNPPPGLNEVAIIAAARKFSGNHPQLLYVLANKAIQQKDWPKAAEIMVRLVETRNDQKAAAFLASLAGSGLADDALQALLKPGGTWIARSLPLLPQVGVPTVRALPLIRQAMGMGLINTDISLGFIRELKAGGQWYDAYALWARLLNRPVDLLFNGSFETGFVRDGFDWETKEVRASRAGVLLSQPQVEGHGRVLQLDFTGRPIDLPMLRQVILIDRTYRLKGQFMARKLRVNEGLAWVFSCVATKKEIARSAPLKDTAGNWQNFSVTVSVPAGCGDAIALELQTQAPYESIAGVAGTASFDNLQLEFVKQP